MSIEEKKEEAIYQGNKIPKILGIAYVVFILWGAIYFIKYLTPDLIHWLNK